MRVPALLVTLLATLLTASGLVAAPMGTNPAAAFPSGMLAGVAPGEAWVICQGYNNTSISHSGALRYSLDLTAPPGGAGSVGCNGPVNATANKQIVAPANGVVAWNDGSGFCLNLDGGDSFKMYHVTGPARGSRVSGGQVIGNVYAAGYAANGGYAHLHIAVYPGAGCGGSEVPFAGAARLKCAPDMTSSGAFNQWSGVQLPNDCGGSAPTGAGTSIQNPVSGRCVDVAGASPNPGAAVQLFDCNGSAAQGWRLVGSQLRVYANPERCLDVSGAVFANGTGVQTYNCGDGNQAQSWSVRSDGTIRTVNGFCLDARDGGTANGTRLQIWECNGTQAQMWAGPAFDNGGAVVRNPASGRCVDATGGSSALRTAVQLHDCNNTAAQHWVREGQAIRVYGNECLDVTDGNLTNGQQVQLWQCGAGNQAQMWSVRTDGTIRTVNGLCLDARNGGTANGTMLQVWDCNGSGAQSWSGLPADPVSTPPGNSGGTTNPGTTNPGTTNPGTGGSGTGAGTPAVTGGSTGGTPGQAVGGVTTGNPVTVPAPTAVTGTRVAFPAKRTAVLTWTAPANTTSYRVRVSKKNSTKKWQAWTTVAAPSVRLTKLKKKGTYRLQITPVGPGGAGATSTWKFKQKK